MGVVFSFVLVLRSGACPFSVLPTATDGPLADRKPFLALVQVEAHGVEVRLDALHMLEDLLTLLCGFGERVWPEWVEVAPVVGGGAECCFECLEGIVGCIILGGEGIAARAVVMDEGKGHDGGGRF